mgnify:CR=1 FL=1
MESSDAFFNLADSIIEATKATDYYSNEILKCKNIQNNSGRVEKITDDNVLYDYIYILLKDVLYRCDKSFEDIVLKTLDIYKRNYTNEIYLKTEEILEKAINIF